MTEHTRFRIEDDPALVRRDGCLLVLAFLCFFWAGVAFAVWWALC
jgi:hypothetical protein